jgi:hypothetical protein
LNKTQKIVSWVALLMNGHHDNEVETDGTGRICGRLSGNSNYSFLYLENSNSGEIQCTVLLFSRCKNE